MLLIRGLGSEAHAKLINEGLIGCRDVASTLTKSNNGTGYANSDYFESMFMKNRMGLSIPIKNTELLPSAWARVLKVILDHYINQTYLTYFHIVESEVTLDWLDSHWPEGGYFMYYFPHFENEESVYGENYCGQRVVYVDSPEDINVRETLIENPSLVLLLGEELAGSKNFDDSQRYLEEVIDSSVPLFNRIRNGRFNDDENEYRIMARSHRSLDDGVVSTEILSRCKINFEDTAYTVSVKPSPDDATHTVFFDVKLVDDKGEVVNYFDIAKRGGTPELVSNFIDIDIRDTAERYGYIGDLEACKQFVRHELSGSDKYCREDENHHMFCGDWKKLARTRRNRHCLKDFHGVVLRVPETQHYLEFGPGYREAFLPSPMEVGYSNPSEAFTNTLERITKEFELEKNIPYGLVHELLHACLASWLPLKLYRPVPLEDVFSELEKAESGLFALETPSEDGMHKEYAVRLNQEVIRARLEKNITHENMMRSIALRRDDPTLKADRAAYVELTSAIMDSFDAIRQQGIGSIIDSLEHNFLELRREIHYVRFCEMDGALRKLKDNAGLLFEYGIDSYKMQCQCVNHLCENPRMPFFLCPVRYDGWADLSDLSYALSKPITASDCVATYLFLLNVATWEGVRDAADKEWRLVCGECDKRDGIISARLKPSRILIPDDLPGADQILKTFNSSTIRAIRLEKTMDTPRF